MQWLHFWLMRFRRWRAGLTSSMSSPPPCWARLSWRGSNILTSVAWWSSACARHYEQCILIRWMQVLAQPLLHTVQVRASWNEECCPNVVSVVTLSSGSELSVLVASVLLFHWYAWAHMFDGL